MYSLSQIRKGIKWGLESPSLVFREANRIYYGVRKGFDYNHDGTSVLDEDWDTLIILDACRYDMFCEESTFSGPIEKRESRGSHTSQFIRGNFDGRTLHDVVYTNGSPQLEKRRDEIDAEFHAVSNVWNSNRWNDDLGTIPPEDMTDAAIEAHQDYPNKRHIVHYMQPHYPFFESDINRGTNWKERGKFDLWDQLIRGRYEVSPDKVWEAYRDTLRRALPAVQELLDEIDGRVVVTSDHGNMIGERASPIPIKEWGHPIGIYTDELVTVPWNVHDDGTRRKIKAERPQSSESSVEDTVVTDRLQDLGYV